MFHSLLVFYSINKKLGNLDITTRSVFPLEKGRKRQTQFLHVFNMPSSMLGAATELNPPDTYYYTHFTRGKTEA